MKTTLILLVVVAFFALAYAYPAEEFDIDPVQIDQNAELNTRQARQFGFGRYGGYGGYGGFGGYRPYGGFGGFGGYGGYGGGFGHGFRRYGGFYG